MKNRTIRFLLFYVILLILTPTACAPTPSPTPNLAETAAPTFDQFVDASFKDLLRRDPELVTVLGVSELLGMQNDQLTPVNEDYLKATRELESQTLANLHRYDRAFLPEDQQRIYDTYEWYLDDLVRAHPFANRNYLVSQMIDSPDQTLTQLFRDQQPVHSAEDARRYINRLGLIEGKMNEVVTALEKRREEGVVLPAFLIDWTLSGVDPLAYGDSASSPFYTGLKQKLELLSSVGPEEKEGLLSGAEKLIGDSVQPGFQKLSRELTRLKQFAPSQIGIGSLPDGQEYYDYLLRHHTSTDMDAEEIHQLGLSELEKIHTEMRSVFNQLGYPQDESLPVLYQRVARDGGTLTGSEVFTEYDRLIRSVETESAPLFNLSPSSKVVVQADALGGFYIPPSMDGSRPGVFYASNDGATPYYIIPTLTYHETIPGHHTQMALVGELGMPLFQSVASFNGYVEGWALYAEKLMAESGAYNYDPYGQLGYLQYAARRAARLVIDTGIHSKGWNFEKAYTFMVENTGMSERESQYEAARMAVIPGQAVSYYIGFLKILELREKAKVELGEKFDLRKFHDSVLRTGPAPLSVLEREVDRYISENIGD